MSAATNAAGVHDPRSLGIARYVDRLAGALGELGVAYRPCAAPPAGALAHYHLGNSSRRVVAQAACRRERHLLTVHDVLPRARALRPAQRRLLHPLASRRAARVVVHSAYAADLLAGELPRLRGAIEVVPHPATPPPAAPLAPAAGLGADDERPLFLLPGVLKRAKLVERAVAAAAPLLEAGRMRMCLAGPVADRGAARAARAAGALVLAAPGDAAYAAAVMAADVVLVLRAGSVGETNGPLLDAIGAGRAVLATPVGSIPEVAGDGALLVEPDAGAIRRGMETLLDPAARASLEIAARRRASALTWEASARAHRALLEELGDG